VADLTSIGPKVEIQEALARNAARMHEISFSSRGGKLLGRKNAIKATTDFDLITWLVIKNAQ
jgi:hypothetical protein